MAEQQKNKILIVEDSAVLREALRFGLQKAGFEVFTATDGVEGIEGIKKNIPDMVLLDIMMPNKNGFDVLSATKEFRNKKNIKVIMLTNFSAEENIEKCFSLGADDFLVKANFTVGDIVSKINKMLTGL